MLVTRHHGARVGGTRGAALAAVLGLAAVGAVGLPVAAAHASGVAVAAAAQQDPVDVTVDADDIAADNVNGLTFKGFGALSGNSSSAVLMDYKAQHPKEYAQLLQVLFGGSHPLMNQVKIEMGDDRNTSTGPEPATMRTADEPANVAREPGFQLAADAKKLNPDLKVSILRWEAPAWASTNDKIYTWYKNTILAAYRTYGYMVDYVNPGVNESTADLAWSKDFSQRVKTDATGYVSDDASLAGFRPGEAALFHQIKTVISDEAGLGSFGDDMVADSSLRDAVDVASYHYNTDDDAAGDFKKLAQVFDKEVWNSEAQATFSNSSFRPNNNTKDPSVAGTGIGGVNGPLEMANTVVKGFVNSNRTAFVYQPAIGSFYEGGQYSFKELVSARDPWSGWMHYDAGLAVLGQFADFAVTGWENADNTAGIWRAVPQASRTTATGTNPVNGRNGQPDYLTLAAPDRSDFSTVVVNDSEYVQTYRVTPEHFTFGADQKLAVWETRAADDGEAFDANYKRHVGDVQADADGTYTVTVKPYSIATVTSLDVASDADNAWNTPLPVEGERTVLDVDPSSGTLWKDDFDYSDKTVPVIAEGGGLSGKTESFVDSRGGETGTIPLYTWDRNGGFEAVKTAHDGWVLRQQIDRTATGVGGAWNGGDPVTAVGDRRWTNYEAGVDVKFLGSADGRYAAIGARSSGGSGSASINGTAYALKVAADGSWQLLRMGTAVAKGTAASGWDATAWHHLTIRAAGATITASVDGTKVATFTDDDPYRSGWVDLASSFDHTEFDNLTVQRVQDEIPYYGEYLDDEELTDLSSTPQAKLVYAGTWAHANGGSMYQYQRSTSTTSTKGSSVSYTFTGSGLDLLGANDGTATLDVSVDGTPVALGAKTQTATDFQALYALRGLPWGKHTVTVSLASGKLVLDAVGVASAPASGTASTTALAAALQATEKVKRTGDFTDATWSLLQHAIFTAKKAVVDPAAYRLDADGATQLAQRLVDASDPLLGQIASLAPVSAATWTGEAPTGLAATVAATLVDGTSRDVPVTWDLGGLSFATDWATVSVPGHYGSARTTARVEVVPRGAVAFADVSGTKPVLGSDSPAYTAVRGLVGDGLVNDAPDQGLAGDATWGHFATNAKGAAEPYVKGVVAGPYDKTTTTGLYTANQVGAKVGYTLDLPAGRYTIAAGTYSWWPTSSRTEAVSLTYDGAAHQVGTVTLDSSSPGRVLSYDVVHAEDGPVTLTLTATNAQSPMLSWVGAVAQPAAWDAAVAYTSGDRVTSGGRTFVAQWWTQAEVPGASSYGAWAEVGAPATCQDVTAREWTDSWVYTGGETVVHDGALWKAQWWTRDQEPGANDSGPWSRAGTC
ncbi:carbohydrate-binding protein [Luteimicrobium sp. DT211]|uniref:carbohydrate-binding protein n=1 Tax=Luteimicrobium sp. DT211 TaxID=3393412 RepID=UPI003CE885BD